MHRFLTFALGLCVAPALTAAEPVASSARPPTSADAPPPAPRLDTEPEAAALAAAPPADRASGVVVPGPRARHPVANTLLAIPRTIAILLLTGPRYAAARYDSYLESRSPNAFGRDVQRSWRFGATAEWETELGGSVAARVGRSFSGDASGDAYVGALGPRGYGGGVAAKLGSFTGAHLEPAVSIDGGRGMDRVFAGIGERGPRVDYERDELIGAASLDAHTGDLRIGVRGAGELGRDRDDNGALALAYGPLRGAGEVQRAGTAELSAGFDSRHGTRPWVRASAPSAGTLVRATVSYTRGRAADTGLFSTGRGTLEVRQLFDLFHGDRILSVGARGEAITAHTGDVPFDRLPSLGGTGTLRAFARDELRGRAVAAADILYEWPLSSDSHAYVFVETGGASQLHVGYGGGIRMLSGATTWARVQIAGADDGVLGVYLQLGAL